MTASPAILHWTERDEERQAAWHSESAAPPPRRVVVADDTMTADTAFRMVNEGTALLWRGDFQNARQLLQALTRRMDNRKKATAAPTGKKAKQAKAAARPTDAKASLNIAAAAPAGAKTAQDMAAAAPTGKKNALEDFPHAFHLHRQARAQRARALNLLLLPFDAGHVLPLRRAPDVREACEQAHGPATQPYVASLRELLGLVGAWQWRQQGVPVPALGGAHIHPWYGVYSPVRGEYLDLIAQAPLPPAATAEQGLAYDIGTGTGVIAALLARRGVPRVVATDQDPRALACAKENLARLGYAKQVQVEQADLFPAGRAPLVVCNPPWVPAKPSAPVEYAVYDPDSRMLRGFLAGLAAHLTKDGEGWLIISDLAEHLRLRSRETLLEWIADAGLEVVGRLDARPRHGKVQDVDDALHAARSREVTSLWRLRATGEK
ncbi:class I SAM-dependent methyltransferase [Bordetella sp. N]|uniref:methyltransferase n=1 Tax=Bordetella sp. N TaxID=1746199 RepID=UPI00070CF4CC|nr:class I SAM-dependent methyltransferase [Bordetella sp. N]ALM86334.1 methylase [Bordetella sp. N]